MWPTPGERSTDATTRLATAHTERRPSIDPPGVYTACDRCHRPLAAGIYRLQRGHIEGTPATWFICVNCDRELIEWMMGTPPAPALGGTE